MNEVSCSVTNQADDATPSTLTFVGGTGRFLDASGTADIGGTVAATSTPGVVALTFTIDGTITY